MLRVPLLLQRDGALLERPLANRSGTGIELDTVTKLVASESGNSAKVISSIPRRLSKSL